MNTATANPQADPTPPTDEARQASSPPDSDHHEGLRRPVRGRMLGGVAAAAADYLGVDVTVVRIVIAVLTLVGGAGVPLYVAGWLLIPEEGASESLASQLLDSVQARQR